MSAVDLPCVVPLFAGSVVEAGIAIDPVSTAQSDPLLRGDNANGIDFTNAVALGALTVA